MRCYIKCNFKGTKKMRCYIKCNFKGTKKLINWMNVKLLI